MNRTLERRILSLEHMVMASRFVIVESLEHVPATAEQLGIDLQNNNPGLVFVATGVSHRPGCQIEHLEDV